MADGFFPTLVSKDADVNAVSNPIIVQLSDGTDTLPIDATTGIPVNVTNTTVAVTATDLDIRDLNSATDSVAVTDGGGSITVDGSVSVSNFPAVQPVNDNGGSLTVDAVDLDIRNLSSATDSVAVTDGGGSLTVDGTVSISGSVAVTATDLDIRDLNSANDSVTIVDGGGSITVDGAVTVSATDLDIRALTLAEDAVKISANTSANSSVNPIFVNVVNTASVTGEVHDQKTVSALASNATDNHNYTITTAFKLMQITWASSGASKAVVSVNSVVVFTGFIPKQGGTEQITFATPVEGAATQVVRIAVTNRESQAQDVYSTIIGLDA